MSKRLMSLLIVLLVAGIATGRANDDRRGAAYRASMEKRFRILDRAYRISPRRREGPLRADNIRDEEVREIQSIMSTLFPGTIVNISGVVSGCPCEDGPACSDQVWIVAYRPKESLGVLLSKVSGHWTLGPVQQWWLDYEKLQSRRKEFRSYLDYLEAENALTDRFPMCAAKPAAEPR